MEPEWEFLATVPGTMAARIGEGKKEALLALFGMALGILIYALTIKPVKAAFLSGEVNGDIFAQLGVNKWIVIIPAALLFGAIIYFVNKKVSDNNKIF